MANANQNQTQSTDKKSFNQNSATESAGRGGQQMNNSTDSGNMSEAEDFTPEANEFDRDEGQRMDSEGGGTDASRVKPTGQNESPSARRD